MPRRTAAIFDFSYHSCVRDLGLRVIRNNVVSGGDLGVGSIGGAGGSRLAEHKGAAVNNFVVRFRDPVSDCCTPSV